MNAASGSQPACDDDENAPLASGLVVGRLTEVHPDRIVIGILTMYLRAGAACTQLVHPLRAGPGAAVAPG